jgi:TolA-binding protein
MSAESAPITFERFSKALEDLPVESLYAKYTELSNQIRHLESSNVQLEDFAREHDDRDCYEALLENRQVMKRFEERKALIMHEVKDVRGLPWRPREEEGAGKKEGVNGDAARVNGDGAAAQEQEQSGGGGEGEGEGDGVYL